MESASIESEPAQEIRGVPDFLRLAVIWAAASLALLLTLRPTLSLALHFDEVHYLTAAQQGILANATDATAFSAGDFVEFVRAKSERRPPRISPDYDESRDLFELRHHHPPLLQYALALLGPERLTPGHEMEQRLVQFAGGALLIATMLWGYAVLSPRRSLPAMIVIAASGLICAFYMCRELNNHLWIAVTLMPVSLAVGRLMRQPSPLAALIAGGGGAIAYVGLETGMFVAFWSVVALGISLLAQPAGPEEDRVAKIRRVLRLWLKFTAWMVAGFFAVLLAIYPGAIFRLSLVRLFAVRSYMVQRGEVFGGTSVWPVLLRILPLMLPMIVLSLIGLAGMAIRRERANRHFLLAIVVIGLGYGLIMLKFLLNVTYVAPALALLSVPGAVVIGSIGSKPAQWIAAAAMAVSACWIVTTPYPSDLTHASVAQVESLGDLIVSRPAWIQGGHVLKYYRPDLAGQIGMITIAEKGTVLTTRDHKALRYVPITDEQLAGSIVMFGVFNGKPPFEWEKHLPEGTRTLDSPVGKGRIYVLPDKMPARGESAAPPADPDKKDEPDR